MIVDLRDPGSGRSCAGRGQRPVQPAGRRPAGGELTEDNRLAGEALDAQESTLTAPAEVTGEIEAGQLGRAEPVTLTSDPGAVTVLRFEPASGTGPFDSGE